MELCKSRCLSVVFTSVFMSIATSGYSQPVGQNVEARLTAAVKKLETACASDVKKFCSTVTPGEGRAILCMMAHEDKVSAQCDYAVFEASRNLERALDRIEMAAEACWTDIEKNCANIEPGGKRIIQCLMDKKASLQKPCQDVLTKAAAK